MWPLSLKWGGGKALVAGPLKINFLSLTMYSDNHGENPNIEILHALILTRLKKDKLSHFFKI